MESLKNPKDLQGFFSGYRPTLSNLQGFFSGYRPTLSIEHNIVRDIELMELVFTYAKAKARKI